MSANPPSPSDVTRLLQRVEAGDPEAFDDLVPLIYDDLRRIAERRMRDEAEGHTLTTTAVVHEAYLRLSEQESGWENRTHFFAVASRVMRHILIDHARARAAEKRGGDAVRITLHDAVAVQDRPELDLLALDEALGVLAELNERLARVVECRFFGGLTMEETAEALGVSLRTATRDWRRARAYLREMLEDR
jgi:RNA polymerase sigma factor (TIGR02999 family)